MQTTALESLMWPLGFHFNNTRVKTSPLPPKNLLPFCHIAVIFFFLIRDVIVSKRCFTIGSLSHQVRTFDNI